MINKFLFSILLSTLLGVAGCSVMQERQRGPDEQFYYAQLLLERGKHLESIAEYSHLRTAHPGSRYLDAAIFGTGRAHYEQEEYLVAATYFERIVDDFPSSAYRERTLYWVARAYEAISLPAQLDQEYTRMAIDHYTAYLMQNLDGAHAADVQDRIAVMRSRLAEKETLAGEFYLRRRRWAAALVYLDRVTEKFDDTHFFERAQLNRALALRGLARFDEATELLDLLRSEAIDGEVRERAERELEETVAVMSELPAVETSESG